MEDTDGIRYNGRIDDISASGASVSGVSGFIPGDSGVLYVQNGAPDARAGFEVRAIGSDGNLHLKFIPGQVLQRAQDWIATLTSTHNTALHRAVA